jgi:hypothetical protein
MVDQSLQPVQVPGFVREHDPMREALNTTALTYIDRLSNQLPGPRATNDVGVTSVICVQSLVSPILEKQQQLAESPFSKTERAQRMAEWGEHYRQLPSSNVSPEMLREIDFALAKAVICLEQFEADEYRVVERLSFETDPVLAQRYVQLSCFVEWAESYVDRKPPHATTAFDEEPEPLPISLIRDLVSHNSSPVVMELHDSRHIHFSIGHPEGPALYYMSARSENIQRFALLSSLFETIDKLEFLYPFELAVRNYFKEQGFTYIQDAMILVGRASPQLIRDIVARIGLTEVFEERFPSDWRPAIAQTDDAHSITAKLNSEVDSFVSTQRRYRCDPEKARYWSYRPNRSAPDSVTKPVDEDFIR